MKIWDGEQRDISNFTTDRYLQINSCGVQNMTSPCTTLRKHGRVDYHLLLVTAGICEITHAGTVHRVGPGGMALYLPGESQKYVMPEGCSTMWCHFAGTIVPELLESCELTGGVYALAPDESVSRAYAALIQRFHRPGMQNHANASLMELIYSLSDAVRHTRSNPRTDALLPVLTFIHAHYHRPLTLDELAAMTGYSKSRFSHLFAEAMGISPIQYQNDLRLNAARELLSSTNLTVADVARSCGFSDPLYFSRCFRKKYGVSPTEYRKMRE